MKPKIVYTVVLFLILLVSGCSHITTLRTEEIREVGSAVRKDVKEELHMRADSLEKVIDSLSKAQDLINRRMIAELTILANRVADESERTDSRQEEILYLLGMLIGKSDKILSKKVVVTQTAGGTIALDSIEQEAEKFQELEAMFNTARSDYLRGEHKLAYDAFKQIYEESGKKGEYAEESLYGMAQCLESAGQKDKALTLYKAFSKQYPESSIVCTVLFKTSSILAENGDTAGQKNHLQQLLETKKCMNTNEYLQGGAILQEMLDAN
jgi:TolA-binding protein